MAPWHAVTTGLLHLITGFAQMTGISEALSLLVLTLLARLALLPLTLGAALRAERNREKLLRLQPELDRLKAEWKEDPGRLASETLALQRRNGIRVLDGMGLLNGALQALFGLGWFQAIRRAGIASRFLWIGSLARPDLWLAGIVGLLALLAAVLAPGFRPEPSSLLMALLPVAISLLVLATLPSSLGLYWATSNGFSVLQTLALRQLWARELRA